MGDHGDLHVLTPSSPTRRSSDLLTLKVLPRPLCRSTRVIAGLNPYQAVRAMAAALGSQAEVAAAAHIPAHLRGGTALTALRIQGFGPSVQARGALLDRQIGRAHV